MSDRMMGALVGYILGAVVGAIMLESGDWHNGKTIASHQCAHYDPQTGAFTWNTEAKP